VNHIQSSASSWIWFNKMQRQPRRPTPPSGAVWLANRKKRAGLAFSRTQAPIWYFSRTHALEWRIVFILKFTFLWGAQLPSGEEAWGHHPGVGTSHSDTHTVAGAGVHPAQKQHRPAWPLPPATHRGAVSRPPSRRALQWRYQEFWPIRQISRVCSSGGHDVDGAARCWTRTNGDN